MKWCWKRSYGTLDIASEIQSLATFRRRSGDFMKQLKKTERPVVLTVKGKARDARMVFEEFEASHAIAR